MEWARIYRDTVWHLMPKITPYADDLQDFVLANHAAISSWIAEARVMLSSCSQTSRTDLSMLAAMIERGGLAMLPSVGMTRLVKTSTDKAPQDLAICALGHGQVQALMGGEEEGRAEIDRAIAVRVISDVVRAVDFLSVAARNSMSMPGNRVDMTAHAHQEEIQRICLMATSVVMGFTSPGGLSTTSKGRLAA